MSDLQRPPGAEKEGLGIMLKQVLELCIGLMRVIMMVQRDLPL